MVARKSLSRKASFVAALTEAGMSASAWAKNEGGVSKTQLYRVLADPKNSAPLTQKIDRFIAKYVPSEMRAA
jgi:lambda repressor-like predicted transcriptional regulator